MNRYRVLNKEDDCTKPHSVPFLPYILTTLKIIIRSSKIGCNMWQVIPCFFLLHRCWSLNPLPWSTCWVSSRTNMGLCVLHSFLITVVSICIYNPQQLHLNYVHYISTPISSFVVWSYTSHYILQLTSKVSSLLSSSSFLFL